MVHEVTFITHTDSDPSPDAGCKPLLKMTNNSVVTTAVVGLVLTFLAARAYAGIINLSFHPLKGFPGPKLAAVTSWYKTLQEVILGRSWVQVLETLHQQYGEVVRTGPNEVNHLSLHMIVMH